MRGPVAIGGRVIEGEGRGPAFIIAEVGSNHNGDLDLACAYIQSLAAAGADAVKFQSFRPELLFNPAIYPDRVERLKSFTLPDSAFSQLSAVAREQGVVLLTTPFNEGAVDALEAYHLPAWKIASGDLTHFRLLRRVAATGKPVILATGLANLCEIQAAIDTLYEAGAGGVVLLHCVTLYPAPFAALNLRTLTTLERAFGVPVGLSDHSLGGEAAIAARALGACMLEKHVTFDRNQDGPDHPFAATVEEFAAMVQAVRNVEAALGDGIKGPSSAEIRGPRWRARRGLYAARPLSAGHTIEPDDVVCLRPMAQIGAEGIDHVLGMRVKAPIRELEALAWDNLEVAGPTASS